MGATCKPRSAAEVFGVRYTPKNARDRLIEKAIDLFYYQGFNAVGLDRVIREAGVTKTTFYKHFESKEELILVALQRRNEWETQAWQRAVRKLGGKDPRDQLLAVFDVLDLWFNDPGFGGCIFINAAAEFPDPNDPVHQLAASHKIDTRGWFTQLARKGGLSDPDLFGDLFTSIVEGTLVMRHVHGKNDAARQNRQIVEKLMVLHGAASPKPTVATPG